MCQKFDFIGYEDGHDGAKCYATYTAKQRHDFVAVAADKSGA